MFIVLTFLLIGIPLLIGLWIYGIYDAYKGAERFNEAHKTRQCMRCGAQIAMNLSICPQCGNPVPGMAPVQYASPGVTPPGYQATQWPGQGQPVQFQ